MTKVGLWQIAEEPPQRLKETSIDLEEHLETWIENDPALVQAGLEIVGRQITIEGGILDLLAIDPQGRWVVIEIKRSLLKREVIAQVLDYASSLYELSDVDLREKVEGYLEKNNKNLDDILQQRGALDSLNPENREIVSFVIGTGRQSGLERIGNYLSQKYDFPISIITFQVFEASDGSRILAREAVESEVNGGKRSSTIEDVMSLAQSRGLSDILGKVLAATKDLNFYPRPYKTSIMFTPPSNKTRMLFTIWVESKNGGIKTYVGPSAFAEFYPISVEEVEKYIGPDGWRYMNKSEAIEFLNQLQKMFSTFSEPEENVKRFGYTSSIDKINMDSIKVSDFNLERTLKCGQIFRYEKIDDSYLITHRDRLFKVRQEENHLLFSGVDQKFISDFFRLDDDYKAIIKSISKDELMKEVIAENYGMRIIRQDPWECLISYMCSARNSIPGMKSNLSMISERFGRPILHDGHKGFSFPAPGEIADHDVLIACKVGFRSINIHEANKNINEKMLMSLRNKSYEEAKAALIKIKGIGDKIADCISLFSLNKLNAFPVDTWIKKGMTEQYFENKKTSDNEIRAFANNYFGRFSGYANQYLFFHWRMLK